MFTLVECSFPVCLLTVAFVEGAWKIIKIDTTWHNSGAFIAYNVNSYTSDSTTNTLTGFYFPFTKLSGLLIGCHWTYFRKCHIIMQKHYFLYNCLSKKLGE